MFGLSPVRDPVGVLSCIGYLSRIAICPPGCVLLSFWTIRLRFTPRWDTAYAEVHRAAFGLDQTSKLGQLSQGQRARTGLLVALAHRPELLVLDEPSTGLDPIVRRDILTAIIRTIADEGRTVLFSPHLLEIDEPSPAYGLLTKLGSSQCCGF